MKENLWIRSSYKLKINKRKGVRMYYVHFVNQVRGIRVFKYIAIY